MADTKRRRNLRKIGLATLLVVLVGCGDDDPIAPLDPPVTSSEAATTTQDAPPPREGKERGPAENAAQDPRRTALERQAERTVRQYVAALDTRDGERVCALFAPGALDALELPVQRGGCAASLAASIGYRDPRGLPVWQGAEVTGVRTVEIGPGRAKMLATVVTRFADRDEVSVEDDIIYLVDLGNLWRIAKPSSTLYRAIGVADIPPSVLAPPVR